MANSQRVSNVDYVQLQVNILAIVTVDRERITTSKDYTNVWLYPNHIKIDTNLNDSLKMRLVGNLNIDSVLLLDVARHMAPTEVEDDTIYLYKNGIGIYRIGNTISLDFHEDSFTTPNKKEKDKDSEFTVDEISITVDYSTLIRTLELHRLFVATSTQPTSTPVVPNMYPPRPTYPGDYSPWTPFYPMGNPAYPVFPPVTSTTSTNNQTVPRSEPLFDKHRVNAQKDTVDAQHGTYPCQDRTGADVIDVLTQYMIKVLSQVKSTLPPWKSITPDMLNGMVIESMTALSPNLTEEQKQFMNSMPSMVISLVVSRLIHSVS